MTFEEIDAVLRKLPMEFAMRWCEPTPDNPCACMGCANGSELGAGGLADKGCTKAEWEAWKAWKLGYYIERPTEDEERK